jgi:hypothetical protein
VPQIKIQLKQYDKNMREPILTLQDYKRIKLCDISDNRERLQWNELSAALTVKKNADARLQMGEMAA